MTDINWGLAGRTPDYASGAINAFRAGREDRKARVEENAFAKFGQDPNGAINELMAVNPDAAMKLRQQRQQDGERQARVTGATALANNDYKGAAAAFGGAGDAASVMSANAAQVERLEKQGNNLVVHGDIMGTMPVRAVLTPDQARAALKLMRPGVLLFLLTILFRPGAKK